MGLDIRLIDSDDEEYVFSLASAGGWTLVGKWVDTLPQKEFAALVEFLEEGYYEGTDVLSEQLKKALTEHRPKNGDVVKTVEHLLEILDIGDSGETATVINEDYEEEDDDDDDEDE